VIYLVRHGETTWNRIGRQQGHDDSPLTENGIEQARAAGKTLRREVPDIGSVCLETSPLGRARHTALIIADELGFASEKILVTRLLIEHHLGHWQGLTQAEIDARYPGAWQAREENKWDFPGARRRELRDGRRARQTMARERTSRPDHDCHNSRNHEPDAAGGLRWIHSSRDRAALSSSGSNILLSCRSGGGDILRSLS
jgi:broad specificity phosphatase PhoE